MTFCQDKFFDVNQTWNSPEFRFSECFQWSVLYSGPALMLWVFGPLYVFVLWRTRLARLPVCPLHIVRLVLLLAITITYIINLSTAYYQHNVNGTTPYVYYLSTSFNLISMVGLFALMHAERKLGHQPGGLIFLYWFIQSVVNFLVLYNVILDVLQFGWSSYWADTLTFFVATVCTTTQFVLTFFPDRASSYAPEASEQNPNPEYRMPYILKATFSWMLKLMLRGYRTPLTLKDLYNARPGDKTSILESDFYHEWKKEIYQNAPDLISQSDVSYKVSDEGTPLIRRNSSTKYSSNPSSLHRDSTAYSYQNSSYPSHPLRVTFSKKASLFKAISRYMLKPMLGASFFQILYLVFIHVNPLILNLLINFTSNPAEYVWHGYLYAAMFLVCGMGKALSVFTCFYMCQILGLRLRSSLMSLVYKKSINLSSSSRQSSSVGEIVNLMSTDAQRFYDVSQFFTVIWATVLQIVIEIAMLWIYLGPAVLAGLAAIILLIPATTAIAIRSRTLYSLQMGLKDQRLKTENEILTGIKVIKFYGWEVPLLKKVNDIRNRELRLLFQATVLRGVSSVLWNVAPFLVSLLSFMTYVLQGNTLTPNIAFVSLSLFNMLKLPLLIIPMLLAFFTQAHVSLRRLERFFLLDEMESDVVSYNPRPGIAASITSGHFSWDISENTVLSNINLEVPQGALVGVVGTVGSGKSSLVSALLGEMNKISGRVEILESLAYVAQQAFILNDTVQNNILFNSPLNKKRYLEILEASALIPDLELLQNGDQSEIGEKGVNLSGGQRQRISLARAVYSDKELTIFDDPLSAVDAHVGNHIFEKIIGPDGLLKGKTRILVTHGISHLSKCDLVVVVMNGCIDEVGSYHDLMENGLGFSDLIKNYSQVQEEESDSEEVYSDVLSVHEDILSDFEGDKLYVGLRDDASPSTIERVHRLRSRNDSESATKDKTKLNKRNVLIEEESKHESSTPKKAKLKLIEDEKIEIGEVKRTVYIEYFRCMGFGVAFMMVLAFLLQCIMQASSDFWISIWTNSLSQPALSRGQQFYLGIYGLFGCLMSLFSLAAFVLLSVGSLRSSRNLHERLLKNILHCPMSFFETTPLGRILNRFGKDVDSVDVIIPLNLSFFLSLGIAVIIINAVILISTPLYTIVFIPLSLFYFFILKFYLSTNRQLKRLESVTRSPIFSHFQQTINGLSTIRAYRQQNVFMTSSYNKIDDNIRSYYLVVASYRWLGVTLELLASIIVFSASLFAVLGREAGTVNPGSVGLSVTYALNITMSLTQLITQYGELEANVVAVERIKEYCEIENEANWTIEHSRTPIGWPDQGAIQFSDYSTRYRPGLDLVLKRLNLVINNCEKIGIIGRTGAGKSSVTQSLFRIIEPAYGSITIDNIDISKIGLHDLRTKITIIPQEPVIFAGSLRFNLDPFNEHSDQEVWQALEHCHLKPFVQGLANGVLFECAEDGENLSVGQRQLLCLGRALLRHTKIIVLDEATAAVDMETDALIQSTIRTEFADCTILVIAHRLNTIMDSSRILVLDSGKVEEFDTPQKLLQKKGMFYAMAKEAGIVN